MASYASIDEPIENMALSIRAYRCLYKYGIKYIGDLTQLGKNDLLRMENMGVKTVKEIEDELSTLGLALREQKKGNPMTGQVYYNTWLEVLDTDGDYVLARIDDIKYIQESKASGKTIINFSDNNSADCIDVAMDYKSLVRLIMKAERGRRNEDKCQLDYTE